MNTSASLIGRIMSKTGLLKTAEKKDRRRAKRHRMDCTVQVRLHLPSRPDARSPHLPARLYDLSEHGLGLLTDSIEWEGLHMIDPNMQTSEKCIVEVEIPFDDEPLRLKGKAVWYIRHPEGIPFIFRVGIEFIDVTPELRKNIKNLINLHVSAAELP